MHNDNWATTSMINTSYSSSPDVVYSLYSTAKENCNEDSEEEWGFVAGYREKLSQPTPHISEEAQQYLFENARLWAGTPASLKHRGDPSTEREMKEYTAFKAKIITKIGNSGVQRKKKQKIQRC